MSEVIKTILTADSSDLRAEFAKAANAANDYQAKQRDSFAKALSAHDLEIRALKLEADGFKNLATSMRETTALREQAARLAATANITEKKALAILQQELSLRKNIAAAAGQQAAASAAAAARTNAIANPRATGLPGGHAGLAPLTPQSLQAMERQIAQTKELRRQTLLAGQAGKNGSLGFLAFSQAVEDAQYGIKGVLNNIPQMILGFGGTAGLAGAISLAAVAAISLYPLLKRLYGAADNEALQKASKTWDELFTKGIQAARALRDESESAARIADIGAQYNQILSARLSIGNALTEQNDQQLAASREARNLAAEILAARQKLVQAQGAPTGPIEQQARDAENAGTESDLKNRQQELGRLQAELARIVEIRDNIAAETTAAKLANNEELVRLTENLAGAEANLAASGERNSAQAVEAIKNQITALKEKITITNDGDAAALQSAEETIRQLDARNNKTYQEIQALKALVAQRKELQKIEADTTAVEAAAAARKKAADEAKAYFQQWKRDQQELADLDQRRATRNDLAAELQALQYEAQGHKDLADKYRSEINLRREAKQLAKDLSITELEAIKILREKARLTEEIARRGNTAATRRSGITRRDNGPGDFNAGNNTQRWKWNLGPDAPRIESRGNAGRNIENGIRATELRRRAGERRATTPRSDSSIKLLERQLDTQERMLKVWETLDAI